MSITRIGALMLRQYYLLKHNPTRVVQIFIWILLEIVLWGFISRYVSDLTETNMAVVFLGSILLWEFMVRVMQGLAVAFFEDVWSRNFLNIFGSPLSIGEYVLSLVGTTIGTSFLGLIGLVAVAGIGFGLDFAVYGLMFLPFLGILFLTGVALGIFGVALVLRLGPAAEWFVWPIPAVLAPFAGVFYPISTLPAWMQMISQVLAPAYVFEGMRTIASGGAIDLRLLSLSLGLSLIYLAISYAYLRRVYKRAVETGLLARYTAETAS